MTIYHVAKTVASMLCMIDYTAHDDSGANAEKTKILTANPNILIDNTAHGLWGVSGGYGGSGNTIPSEYASTKVYSYISGDYENTGHPDTYGTLATNLTRITGIAADGAYGVFLDEVSPTPDATDKVYLQAIKDACDAAGLELIINTGVSTFDYAYLTTICDYIMTDEAYTNRAATASETGIGLTKVLVVSDVCASSANALTYTAAALAAGFAATWMTDSTVYALPSYFDDYIAGLPGASNENDGSAANPWLTIDYGADTMAAGDTLYVHAGTYNEQVKPNSGGSVGSIMTIMAYPGDTVIIDGTDLTRDYEGLIHLDGLAYVTIDGFELQNAVGSGSGMFGIAVVGDAADNIILQNCTIHDTNISGIKVGSSAYEVTNITIDNCTLYDTNISANQEMMTLIRINGFEVKNCVVHSPTDTQRVGIDMKSGCTNGSVHDCEVYDVYDACIYIDSRGDTSNVDIYNNYCHDGNIGEAHAASGIVIATETATTETITDVQVYNNIVKRCAWGIVWNNTEEDTCTFVSCGIQYNSLYDTGATGVLATFRGTTDSTTYTTCTISNNIIHSITNNATGIYDLAPAITPTGNLYYNSGGAFADAVRIAAETGAVLCNPVFRGSGSGTGA